MLWTHPAFSHIFVPPTSRHLGTGGQDDNLTHNFVLKQRDSGPKGGHELQLLQRCAHFSLRGRVDGFVRAHVELWIKHVLDQTTELHEAVGLQIVQGDIVQRRDLHQSNNGGYLCAKHILPAVFLLHSKSRDVHSYFTAARVSSFSLSLKNSTTFSSHPEANSVWAATKDSNKNRQM